MKLTFDPTAIDCTAKGQDYLEYFLLFAMSVHGKNSDHQNKVLSQFLALEPAEMPFDSIRAMLAKGTLLQNMETVRLGQYKDLARGFAELVSAGLDLRRASIAQLESVHKIGPKTSRFFVERVRQARVAVLDSVLLRYMREVMGVTSAPKQTPQNRERYEELAELLLAHLESIGKTDQEIWNEFSGRGN